MRSSFVTDCVTVPLLGSCKLDMCVTYDWKWLDFTSGRSHLGIRSVRRRWRSRYWISRIVVNYSSFDQSSRCFIAFNNLGGLFVYTTNGTWQWLCKSDCTTDILETVNSELVWQNIANINKCLKWVLRPADDKFMSTTVVLICGAVTSSGPQYMNS